jgi:hypothetical protein
MRLGVGLRWIILAALSATACLPMFAGAMINFSCEVGDGTGPGQSVSGPNPCSLTGTGSEGLESQATAQFVRTPVLPLDNFQSTTSFSASVAASAYALCGFTQTMDCLISGASATITWETFATTAGPERLGYIDLSFVGSFDYPGEELAFGGNNEQVGQYGASENEAGNSIMLPFTLGVPFEMMLSIGINAGNGGARSNGDHIFRGRSILSTFRGRWGHAGGDFCRARAGHSNTRGVRIDLLGCPQAFAQR